jgi:hypothetical protein
MRSWFGALLLALPTAAAGLPVFDNGVTADQLGQGDVATSDMNGGTPRQRIADDFSFDEATDVSGIRFVGGFFPGNTTEPENFQLRFFADDGGQPGAVIGSPIALTTTRQDTGFDWDGGLAEPLDLYTFSGSFAPVSFAPGSYWFSVLATTPPGGDEFVLVALRNAGTLADSLDQGLTWRLLNESLSFVLLPEPSSALLAAAALLGVAAASSRRAR